MIKTVEFNGQNYPEFQALGNSAQFALPYAKHICTGIGYDIGCNKLEWSFPGSIPIDPIIDNKWCATNLPFDKHGLVDYIFSSHCLEHINTKWYDVLSYWLSNLKDDGGVLFLYLPDFSQEYWRPWNNTKHVHVFTPDIVKSALVKLGLKNIFVSGVDLNNSFIAMGEKNG